MKEQKKSTLDDFWRFLRKSFNFAILEWRGDNTDTSMTSLICLCFKKNLNASFSTKAELHPQSRQIESDYNSTKLLTKGECQVSLVVKYRNKSASRGAQFVPIRIPAICLYKPVQEGYHLQVKTGSVWKILHTKTDTRQKVSRINWDWSLMKLCINGIEALTVIWAATSENRSSGFPTRPHTNQAAPPQKMARGLKFCI